jgi:hypothetical protein
MDAWLRRLRPHVTTVPLLDTEAIDLQEQVVQPWSSTETRASLGRAINPGESS